jgi:hypothetical protein
MNKKIEIKLMNFNYKQVKEFFKELQQVHFRI